MILQESLNEVVPHVRDAMIRNMQQGTTEFIRCSEQDPIVKSLLFKLRSNPQSRSTWLNFKIGLAQQERKWEDKKVSEDRAEKEKAEEEAAAEDEAAAD